MSLEACVPPAGRRRNQPNCNIEVILMNTCDANYSVTIHTLIAERIVCALLATVLTWASFSSFGGLSFGIGGPIRGKTAAFAAADPRLANASSSLDGAPATQPTSMSELARDPWIGPTVVVVAHRIAEMGP
jgi:hypothetical protein